MAGINPAMTARRTHLRGDDATGIRAPLPVLAFPAQRRQADTGSVEAAVDGEQLPGDIACALAAQEEDRIRQFFLEAIAIERNGVVIVGADRRRMHRLGHRGIDRPRRHRVDAGPALLVP